jgi:hypothetical protein
MLPLWHSIWSISINFPLSFLFYPIISFFLLLFFYHYFFFSFLFKLIPPPSCSPFLSSCVLLFFIFRRFPYPDSQNCPFEVWNDKSMSDHKNRRVTPRNACSVSCRFISELQRLSCSKDFVVSLRRSWIPEQHHQLPVTSFPIYYSLSSDHKLLLRIGFIWLRTCISDRPLRIQHSTAEQLLASQDVSVIELRGSVFGWDTMLEARRSRVRVTMR